jgi:hypothetical protein
LTSPVGFEGATGWGFGGDTTVDLGGEIFRCSGFASWGGFGVGRFGGLVCTAGVAAVTGFFSSVGVAAM